MEAGLSTGTTLKKVNCIIIHFKNHANFLHISVVVNKSSLCLFTAIASSSLIFGFFLVTGLQWLLIKIKRG